MTRRLWLVGLIGLAASVGSAHAQTSAEPEPIRCWWRTSSGSIAIGQTFSLVLTCATLDNDTSRVQVDEARLGVGAIQLAPFEIVSSVHPADLQAPGRRFFQYSYVLRLIDADAIGRDVTIPDLQIRYRLNARDLSDPAAEGRERIYTLPGIPLRVLSLVPADATDIRDTADAGFEGLDALRFRARAFEIASLALALLGAVFAVPLVRRLFGRAGRAAAMLHPHLGDRTVLRQVSETLDEIRRASRGGWTEPLLSRALAAARVASALALGRAIRQRWIADAEAHPDGSLVVPGNWRDRRRIVVTSPLTTTDLAEAQESHPPKLADRREAVKELHASIAAFTAALYQRGEPTAAMPLDDALEGADRAVNRLRRAVRWRLPIRFAEQPRPRLESSR